MQCPLDIYARHGGGGYQPVWESNPAPTKTLKNSKKYPKTNKSTGPGTDNVYNAIHFIITDIQLVGLDQGRTQFGDSRIIKTLEASLWREQDGQDFYNQQTVTGEEETEQ